MSAEQRLIETIHVMVLGSLKPEETLIEVSKLIFSYKDLKKHKIL